MFEPRFRLCFIMLFLFAAAAFVFSDIRVAIAEAVICVAVYVILISASRKRAREMQKYIEETMMDISRASKDATLNFPMATAVIKLETNELIWSNALFEGMVEHRDRIFEKHLFDLIPEFDLGWILEGKSESPYEAEINGKNYRVFGNLFRSDDGNDAEVLITLYWLDITEYKSALT